jgi:hypothetical protein
MRLPSLRLAKNEKRRKNGKSNHERRFLARTAKFRALALALLRTHRDL